MLKKKTESLKKEPKESEFANRELEQPQTLLPITRMEISLEQLKLKTTPVSNSYLTIRTTGTSIQGMQEKHLGRVGILKLMDTAFRPCLSLNPLTLTPTPLETLEFERAKHIGNAMLVRTTRLTRLIPSKLASASRRSQQTSPEELTLLQSRPLQENL